jgi:hypothetical protein
VRVRARALESSHCYSENSELSVFAESAYTLLRVCWFGISKY